MMSRRGRAARESGWLLACAAHNLRKTAPAPHGGMTTKGRIPISRSLGFPRTAASRSRLRSGIAEPPLHTALCDRLIYASHVWTGMRVSAAVRIAADGRCGR